jgi:hypothetical protein
MSVVVEFLQIILFIIYDNTDNTPQLLDMNAEILIQMEEKKR